MVKQIVQLLKSRYRKVPVESIEDAVFSAFARFIFLHECDENESNEKVFKKVYETSRNILRNTIKRQNKQVRLDTEADKYVTCSGMISNDDIMSKLWITDILKHLPTKHKEIFTLIYEGYNHNEIADKLGLSVRGVEERCRKMKEWFRERRDEFTPPPHIAKNVPE